LLISDNDLPTAKCFRIVDDHFNIVLSPYKLLNDMFWNPKLQLYLFISDPLPSRRIQSGLRIQMEIDQIPIAIIAFPNPVPNTTAIAKAKITKMNAELVYEDKSAKNNYKLDRVRGEKMLVDEYTGNR
jgi:hypothetical protein